MMLSTSCSTFFSSDAASDAISETGPTTIPSPARSSSVRIRSRLRPPARDESTTWPAYASARWSRSAGSSGRSGRQADASRSAVAWHGAAGEPELGRPVVGHEQQLVRPVGVRHVLGVVLDPAPSSADGPRRRRRVVGVEDPDLAGVAALGQDHDEVAGAAGGDVDLELLVRVLHDQHVVGRRRAEPVPPDLVLAPQVVVHDVEEGRRVGRPGAQGCGAGDDVREITPGRQVAEAQLVDLVAVVVDAVREHRRVGRDRPDTEVDVVGLTDHLVHVEQQLARPRHHDGAVTTGRTPFPPAGRCGRNTRAAAN